MGLVGVFGSSFFIHNFVTYPVSGYLLNGGKTKNYSSPVRKLFVLLFLACISIVSVSVSLNEIVSQKNHFKIMQVARTASDNEIKKAYQRKFLPLFVCLAC